MLYQELDGERKKKNSRDRVLAQLWKTIKVIFGCLEPNQEISELDLEDFIEFRFLSDMEGDDPTLSARD